MTWRIRCVVFIALVLGATACSASTTEVGTPGGDPDATATTSPGSAATATAEPAGTPAPAATAVPGPTEPADPTVEPQPTASPAVRLINVYWTRDAQLAAGGRSVASAAPATAAIEALLAGPDGVELGVGMETVLPGDVELLGLTIVDGTATIDLSSEFEAVSMGTTGELVMVAQIVFTLTQFPTVDSVDIRIDGEDRDYILSHGLAAKGLTRSRSLDAIAPAIVVEQPVPGQQVWAPFPVSGFSRTFESNVQWELRSLDDVVLASGFTTAQQPDVGVHGPFSFDVTAADAPFGGAVLSVFEESARDGSRVNVYDVPIVIMGGDAAVGFEDLLPWLRENGLGPVDFGASIEDAEAFLVPTHGSPIERITLSECGSGASLSLEYDDFSVLADADGRFAGWYFRASDPPLVTPSGIAPGTRSDDLIATYDGVRIASDTLGPEFILELPAGFIGGFLTDDGSTVTAVYAGLTCFFR